MGYCGSQERNRRLKKLFDETKNSSRGGGGAFYDEDKGRYIKYSPRRKPGHAKFLRRVANRKVRRNKDHLRNGQYRKVYDYWWELD